MAQNRDDEAEDGVSTHGDRSPAAEALHRVVRDCRSLLIYFTTAQDEFARPLDLTVPRWYILSECAGRDVTVPDIARTMGLARQSVLRVANQLVRQGYCAFTDNPRHRRSKLLTLTPEGAEVLRRMDKAVLDWENEVGDRIGLALLEETGTQISRLLATLP